MTSGRRPLHPECTPFKALNRLSCWPEEPFRAWTSPGCRFLAVESWLYEGASDAHFSDEVLEVDKAAHWLRSEPKALKNQPPVAGIKMLIIEGSSDPLDTMTKSYDLSSERSVIETAFDAFALSPATGALFSLEYNAPTSPELLKLHGTAENRSTTKYLDFPYQTLAWTSTLEGNIIYAICRDTRAEKQDGSYLPTLISTHMSSLGMPLLLPYLACQLATSKNGVFLIDDMNKTMMLEHISGHQDWVKENNYLENIAIGDELTSFGRTACGLAARAISRKMDALSTQIATRSIIREYLTRDGEEDKNPMALSFTSV